MTGRYSTEPDRKKRARDVSELETSPNSPESKRVKSANDLDFNTTECELTTLSESVTNSTESARDEPDTELVDSVEVNHIPEDILDILEDTETVPDGDSDIQDLESVIKSFEEEILLHKPSSFSQPAVVELMTSDSGESQPDLGYLLGASDDELGLPPTTVTASDKGRAANDPIDLTATNSLEAIEFANMIEFEDELPRYDSFEFAAMENNANDGNIVSGDFVTVDGLFDCLEPSDFSGLTWRPDSSLPAL